MNSFLKIFAALAATVCIGAFVLTGCAASHSADTHASSGVDYSVYNENAVMFAQMMIPHHDQALTLADLALQKSADADIMALARLIQSEQQPEIIQMTSWLTAANAGPGSASDHAGHMDGMLTDTQMAEIEAASGTDFDRLFLEGMKVHHEGAVSMAKDLIENNPNPEVAALAKQIIENQTQEIEYIKGLLKKFS